MRAAAQLEDRDLRAFENRTQPDRSHKASGLLHAGGAQDDMRHRHRRPLVSFVLGHASFNMGYGEPRGIMIAPAGNQFRHGWVAERFKAPVLKTGVPARVP